MTKNELWLYYHVGICPICHFSRLEHGFTWGFRGQWDVAMYYARLDYVSELRASNKWLKPQPVKERLLDVEHTWACAWHYHHCVGVLGWSHLWEVDKWQTIRHGWCVLMEYYKFFMGPALSVWLWCADLWIIWYSPEEQARLLINMAFDDSTGSWVDVFFFWVGIICLSVSTIWARGVGPRVRPDQLSELVWTCLLPLLAGLLLFLICYISF